MSAKSSIEWTDVTWNPVRGCSLVSAGCRNCYAMKQAHRFSGPGQPYEGLTMIGQHGPSWIGTVKTVPWLLDEPLHWKKPRKIFVNSMSDLFHRDVPDEFIEKVFVVMARSPRHTYQVLTKRPGRMLEFMRKNSTGGRIFHLAADRGVESGQWPLSNVWLGVSVEDQATADERIPILLQTPAAVRWVSAEPLLGPVDIRWKSGSDFRSWMPAPGPPSPSYRGGDGYIDWVVVGGESGPRARPCDLAWIRSIKDQCQEAGVPVFVKQLGAFCKSTMPNKPTMEDGQRFIGDIRALQGRIDRKGSNIKAFPVDLRVRGFPGVLA
jgi:protein gp37